jgi:hypothetical protein
VRNFGGGFEGFRKFLWMPAAFVLLPGIFFGYAAEALERDQRGCFLLFFCDLKRVARAPVSPDVDHVHPVLFRVRQTP